MALKSQSLFLYGYQISETNSSIDFVAVGGGPTLLATLNLGYYSLSSLLREVVRALSAADTAHTYTATANRSVGGGLENRVTISSSSASFSLLFGSGPRASSSVASLIGYHASDYTSATSYTGYTSSGTLLVPSYVGYNYLSPEMNRKTFGSQNISANGTKETVVWQIQRFVQVEFKYEPRSSIVGSWLSLTDWMIKQRPFDFTPESSSPSTFYEVTLEKSGADSKGMAQMYKEMLPNFPDKFQTGSMTFRLVES